MPGSADPKGNDSSMKTERTQLSIGGNARTNTSSPKPLFTMTTRSKAREETRNAELQARKVGRKLLFEEMKFEEIRLSGKAREAEFLPRKERVKRIRQAYLRLLRRFKLDFSGRGLSEKLELPSALKGNALRAAILEAASKRREESSSRHDVRPDMPTVGGLPRWDFEG